MNCKACGAELHGAFCTQCGAPADEAADADKPLYGQPAPPSATPPATGLPPYGQTAPNTQAAGKPPSYTYPPTPPANPLPAGVPGYYGQVPSSTRPSGKKAAVALLSAAVAVLTIIVIVLAVLLSSANATIRKLRSDLDNIPGITAPYEDPGDNTPGSAVVGGTVIYDDNGIKITFKELDMTAVYAGELRILIENNSDKEMCVQIRGFSVNGYPVDAYLSEDVGAGKKSDTYIGIIHSDLEENGIETITEIKFIFHIFSWDIRDLYYDSDTIVLTF